MSTVAPSPTGSNGRDARGRFTGGNGFGRGNPLAAQVQRIRSELIGAMTPAAVRRIAAALIRQAEKGDVPAAKVLFAWSLGEPIGLDLLERLNQLEAYAERVIRR